MVPLLLATGLLPPGVHETSWDELRARYGGTADRRDILQGLRLAATVLHRAGCTRLWIDGSFVTGSEVPSDWDGCWDPRGVDPALLDTVLLDFSPEGRRRMKLKYRADLLPTSLTDDAGRPLLVAFFQVEKASGAPKGILSLDLTRWTP